MAKEGILSTGNILRALAMAGLLAAESALAATNAISSVSPATSAPGVTNLLVVFTLAATPPPPGTNIAPTLATLGTNVGTSLTHTNQYIVTARFNLPASEPPGSKDALVRFPGPSGGVYYAKSDAFAVQSTQVVYVAAANTNGPWTGAAWATAYRDLQDALAGALGAVWIAEGTYRPATNADRAAHFALRGGLSLYGGFAGTETSLGQRDPAAHPTVLSGDVGAGGAAADNAYHVLVGVNNATLDGLVIADGNADGRTYDGFGGGLVCYDATSVTVVNCTFRGNRAREGGAVYSYNDSVPQFTGCAFVSNAANKGGAAVCRDGSNSAFSNCLFAANAAAWRGGAVFVDYGASPRLLACTFVSNSTPGHGGAVYVDDTASQIGFTSPAVSNCAFSGNSAGYRGGAVANYNKCTPVLRGNAFSNNAAGTGGGAIANDYGVTATLSGNTFTNNSGGSGAADVATDATSQVQ